MFLLLSFELVLLLLLLSDLLEELVGDVVVEEDADEYEEQEEEEDDDDDSDGNGYFLSPKQNVHTLRLADLSINLKNNKINHLRDNQKKKRGKERNTFVYLNMVHHTVRLALLEWNSNDLCSFPLSEAFLF